MAVLLVMAAGKASPDGRQRFAAAEAVRAIRDFGDLSGRSNGHFLHLFYQRQTLQEHLTRLVFGIGEQESALKLDRSVTRISNSNIDHMARLIRGRKQHSSATNHEVAASLEAICCRWRRSARVSCTASTRSCTFRETPAYKSPALWATEFAARFIPTYTAALESLAAKVPSHKPSPKALSSGIARTTSIVGNMIPNER